MVNISKQEAKTLLGWFKSMIECETDAAESYPNSYYYFVQQTNNLISLRKKVRKVMKRKR